MRILHVVRQFHPSIGGVERFTLDLCRYTLRQGHECGVVTLNRDFSSGAVYPAYEEYDGIPIWRVPFFGPRRYRMAPGVLRHLRGFDLLHIHCIDFFVDYLSLSKPLHRRPMVVSTHGGFFHSAWGGGLKKLYFETITRTALRAVDRVVCDSRQDLALFERIAPRKCELIENGIDYASFATVTKRVRPGLLLYLGRTDANKRLPRLVETFARVASENAQAELALVGPDWYGEWPRLQRLVAERGIKGRVHFVGPVSDAEVRRWLAEAHFFVSASAYEGFGIAAVEAMATGTVPLLSDITAFRNILTTPGAGILVNFEDPDAAARQILEALSLPTSAYEEMSATARQAARRYSWDEVGAQFLDLYRRVR